MGDVPEDNTSYVHTNIKTNNLLLILTYPTFPMESVLTAPLFHTWCNNQQSTVVISISRWKVSILSYSLQIMMVHFVIYCIISHIIHYMNIIITSISHLPCQCTKSGSVGFGRGWNTRGLLLVTMRESPTRESPNSIDSCMHATNCLTCFDHNLLEVKQFLELWVEKCVQCIVFVPRYFLRPSVTGIYLFVGGSVMAWGRIVGIFGWESSWPMAIWRHDLVVTLLTREMMSFGRKDDIEMLWEGAGAAMLKESWFFLLTLAFTIFNIYSSISFYFYREDSFCHPASSQPNINNNEYCIRFSTYVWMRKKLLRRRLR